ncbi:MAG: FGGY family carbohydrate kinase, partial [Saprospiraceae bacterium]
MYAIGYDIGSSSIKAALVEISGGRVIARRQEPTGTEMPIDAPQPGWAEQDPESWWHHVCTATRRLLTETGIDPALVQSIGIGYQMHGLVLVDADQAVVRPAVIWCDSRAVDQGEAAFQRIGPERCLSHCLNSPGNFTAAKLKWVAENEPAAYARTHRAMLPGDFIALRFTGTAGTTSGGLSEGVLWDFQINAPARIVLDALQLDAAKLPPVLPNPGIQGRVSAAGAAAS